MGRVHQGAALTKNGLALTKKEKFAGFQRSFLAGVVEFMLAQV